MTKLLVIQLITELALMFCVLYTMYQIAPAVAICYFVVSWVDGFLKDKMARDQEKQLLSAIANNTATYNNWGGNA